MFPHASTARMSVLSPDLQIVASDTVATADLGGESVLLDPTSGRYFGLNEVGTRIFELLSEPRSVADLVDILVQEYDVGAGRLRRDVEEFVGAMLSRGLIQTP